MSPLLVHATHEYYCDIGHAQALSYFGGLPKVNLVQTALSLCKFDRASIYVQCIIPVEQLGVKCIICYV